MRFDLFETAADHRVIVCHRGAAGGNIPCNTLPAYEIALLQGADMIETDISCTSDGTLVVFHPKMEPYHLGWEGSIPQTPYEQVRQKRYVNMNHAPTPYGVLTFDALLETFKGRCYINIDKFWSNPAAIYRAVKRHDMVDQVLVKSTWSEEVIKVLREVGPEIPYMLVVKEEVDWDRHRQLLESGLNYVGIEAVYAREDSSLARESFTQRLHTDGKLAWVNSLIYNSAKQLSGGHSDDTAFTVSMDYGWGWLADKGYDLIQTDWPAMLIDYLKQTDRYYRGGK